MKNITVESYNVLKAMYDISITERTLRTEKDAEEVTSHLTGLSHEEVGLVLEYLADKGYLSATSSNGASLGYYNLTAAGVDKIEGLT